MPSLYEELGLPPDATPEQIKEAYRKVAKKLHPDNQETGDEAAFKRASHAVAILSDPYKRKQYDETGKEDTASPEERENAMALEKLSKLFSHLFTMAEFDPQYHDPLVAVKKLLKMERGAAEKAEAQTELMLVKMRKLIKRLKRKGKDAKAGRLERVLQVLEQGAVAEKDATQRAQRVCNKALEILKEHEYEVDKKPLQKVKAASSLIDEASLKDAVAAFMTMKKTG